MDALESFEPSLRLADEAPVARADGVNFFYGEGEARFQVLFDIGLEVLPGQLVVMTGPSGSGKTTLLTLIGALRSLHEGRIEVLGPGSVAARPQRTGAGAARHRLHLPDAQSVRGVERLRERQDGAAAHRRPFGRRRCASAASRCCERLGLGARINHKPHSLSGGQRQRVAIARALANRPRLVLADEPTAALDKDSTRNVVRLFKEMTVEDGTAILMVTHDHRIIELADRLVHMVDGRIVSDVDAQRRAADLRVPEGGRGLQEPDPDTS